MQMSRTKNPYCSATTITRQFAISAGLSWPSISTVFSVVTTTRPFPFVSTETSSGRCPTWRLRRLVDVIARRLVEDGKVLAA